MSSEGVRVRMTVGSPEGCPLANVSTASSVTSVSRCRRAGGETVVEFTADDGVSEGVTEVFSTDEGTRYRFTDCRPEHCPYDAVEDLGCPVDELQAENGDLRITFFAPDVETVRAIVTALRERFDNVRLCGMSRSGDVPNEEPVVVDRSVLTDRQREVLETAHEMGYFAYLGGANAGEVAAALDISPSTLSEHLAAAQSKLVDAVLDEPAPKATGK